MADVAVMQPTQVHDKKRDQSPKRKSSPKHRHSSKKTDDKHSHKKHDKHSHKKHDNKQHKSKSKSVEKPQEGPAAAKKVTKKKVTPEQRKLAFAKHQAMIDALTDRLKTIGVFASLCNWHEEMANFSGKFDEDKMEITIFLSLPLAWEQEGPIDFATLAKGGKLKDLGMTGVNSFSKMGMSAKLMVWIYEAIAALTTGTEAIDRLNKVLPALLQNKPVESLGISLDQINKGVYVLHDILALVQFILQNKKVLLEAEGSTAAVLGFICRWSWTGLSRPDKEGKMVDTKVGQEALKRLLNKEVMERSPMLNPMERSICDYRDFVNEARKPVPEGLDAEDSKGSSEEEESSSDQEDSSSSSESD